jgi:hypothetical protein
MDPRAEHWADGHSIDEPVTRVRKVLAPIALSVLLRLCPSASGRAG